MHSTFKLKTYRPGIQVPKHSFFILNKGANCGKPLKQPCPNCYILTANSEAETDYLYWLCWGLWQSRSFDQYIWGSVILTIRIGNIAKVITAATQRLSHKQDQAAKAVESLKTLSAYIDAMEAKYKTIQKLKAATAQALLH